MILDEPTAGMDPEARAATRAIVADLRDAGAAILLTSHDLTDVERLADRICVLDGGRIVAAGTPAELTAGARRTAAVPARPAARPRTTWRRWNARSAPAGRARQSALTATAGATGSRAPSRTPTLVAALAGWCATADRLHRRAPDGRRQPRGRLPRARRSRSRRDARVSRAASPLAATLAQTAMELRLTARRGENVLVTLVIPVAVLLFFASVAVLPSGGGRPVDFLLPGTLALAVIATSLVNLGIATAYERSYGVLKRLGGSPLTRGRPARGQDRCGPRRGGRPGRAARRDRGRRARLAPGARRVTGDPGRRALLLGTLAFAGLGLLLAGTLRAEATLALANGLFLGFLLLGGIVLPGRRPARAARGRRRRSCRRRPSPTPSASPWDRATARSSGRWRSSRSGASARSCCAARTFRWE